MEIKSGQERLEVDVDKYLREEILKPESSALLVIDVQNDFCDPKGFFASTLKADISQMASVASHIQELIDIAHKAKVPVIFTQGFEDVEFRKGPDLWRAMKWKESDDKPETVNSKKGTFGAEFYQLQPKPEDIILEKYDWSAFSGKEMAIGRERNLEQILKEKDVQTLVVVGIKTEVCVNATVTEAKAKHYFVVVPREAVATDAKQLHEAYLEGWGFSTGDVIGEDVLKNNWSPKS